MAIQFPPRCENMCELRSKCDSELYLKYRRVLVIYQGYISQGYDKIYEL
jgi:hypothetical protein